MLNLDDERWADLKGGYKTTLDARPLLRSLESGEDIQSAWGYLWEELHHQGDVGEASYAAVPHLVRIHRQRGVVDWNTYALVTTIELARMEEKNQQLPSWLAFGYENAIRELAKTGLMELANARDEQTIRSILGILAIWKRLRSHGRILHEFSEEEVRAIAEEAFGE